MAKYGVIGLGLCAPIVTGVWVGTALGIALNIQPRKLFIWICVGVILWTTIFVIAGELGVSIIDKLRL